MKRFLTLILAIVPLLSMAQDDLYFTPSNKSKVKKETVDMKATAAPVERVKPVDYNSCSRSDDEYNRRYSFGGDSQNAGGAYADDDSLTYVKVDTVYVTDYDLEDPSLDYRYSRRLLRFHSPYSYSIIRNPYYWDLVYGYGAWDYLSDPFYDPWYWHYGWGYGWSWGPWDCWYGGIWGYHHPYHWSYWGWGPGWGHFPSAGGGISSSTHYRPRGEYVKTNGRFGHERIRTNPGLNDRSRSSRGGLRTDGALASSNRSTGRASSVQRTQTSQSGYRGSYSDYATNRSRSGITRTTPDRAGAATTPSRTSANRYGQRTSAPVVVNRDGSVRSSAASSRSNNSSTSYTPSRSYSNSSSSSRSSSYSSSSSSYSGSSSSSSFGGGSRSGGGGFSGGGSRGGGGGGRR